LVDNDYIATTKVTPIVLALSLVDQAPELNPNLAMAFHLSGRIRYFVGQLDLAIKHLERVVRLSPLDPQRPGMLAAIAAVHFAVDFVGLCRQNMERQGAAARAKPS